MTRRLLLLRHAKSDWDADYGADHDRPLAPRGERAAATMGRFLAAAGRQPDLAISSTAVRARTTVELAREAGSWDCELRVTRGFYSSGAGPVLEELAGTERTVATLLIAGHQPTWSELVAVLAGGARVDMPTAAVACVRFETSSWSRIQAAGGTLEWVVTPKLLQRAGL